MTCTPKESLVIEVPMRKAKNLLNQLRAQITRGALSQAEFTASIAEAIAATPPDIDAAVSLQLAEEIRDVEKEWRSSRGST